MGVMFYVFGFIKNRNEMTNVSSLIKFHVIWHDLFRYIKKTKILNNSISEARGIQLISHGIAFIIIYF